MISLSVLFANDDVMTQWIMSEVLTGAGFDVVSACRCHEAMDLLRDGPECDVLLADLALSDMAEDHQLARAWQRALPGRPIIYTGPDRGVLRRPLAVNESFLRTPFSASLLLRTVDAALEEACFRPVFPPIADQQRHLH